MPNPPVKSCRFRVREFWHCFNTRAATRPPEPRATLGRPGSTHLIPGSPAALPACANTPTSAHSATMLSGCSENVIYRRSREGGSPGRSQVLDSRLRGNDDFFRVSLALLFLLIYLHRQTRRLGLRIPSGGRNVAKRSNSRRLARRASAASSGSAVERGVWHGCQTRSEPGMALRDDPRSSVTAP